MLQPAYSQDFPGEMEEETDWLETEKAAGRPGWRQEKAAGKAWLGMTQTGQEEPGMRLRMDALSFSISSCLSSLFLRF